jgi:hypothetical protein
MEEHYSIQRLLALRKLTRAISDLLRGELADYISTLSPLFRPAIVLGEYIASTSKVTAKGADKAFREMQGLYETLAGSKAFDISRSLNPPIEVSSATPEIAPVEYSYIARNERMSKTVAVTSPLKWILFYSGFSPKDLEELIAKRVRASSELPAFLLHYLLLYTLVTRQPGMCRILGALSFPVSAERYANFAELPIICISSPISTSRPPDDVIIESTEISGTNAFEEVANVQDIQKMPQPLKERLIELARSHGEVLPPA